MSFQFVDVETGTGTGTGGELNLDDYSCLFYQRYPHPDDCTKYIVCRRCGNDISIEECDDGEAYNPRRRSCTQDWSSCVNLECTERNQVIADPDDPQVYYVCVGRIFTFLTGDYRIYRRICPDDEIFDECEEACVLDEEEGEEGELVEECLDDYCDCIDEDDCCADEIDEPNCRKKYKEHKKNKKETIKDKEKLPQKPEKPHQLDKLPAVTPNTLLNRITVSDTGLVQIQSRERPTKPNGRPQRRPYRRRQRRHKRRQIRRGQRDCKNKKPTKKPNRKPSRFTKN